MKRRRRFNAVHKQLFDGRKKRFEIIANALSRVTGISEAAMLKIIQTKGPSK